MWDALFKHFPKCRNKVDFSSTGTSETVKYYLGSYEGECYGLDATTERFKYMELKPRTNIENLFLTGPSDILGYGTILDIISDRDIIKDISNLD